jgi:hypothetical protein
MFFFFLLILLPFSFFFLFSFFCYLVADEILGGILVLVILLCFVWMDGKMSSMINEVRSSVWNGRLLVLTWLVV